MADKTVPIGICDLCGESIPRERWYTSKRKPRRYCSRQCRNTGNSRNGASIISKKAKQRVAAGDWENPHLTHPPTPEEQARRARIGRLREVKRGVWRNPALSSRARRKLSRPRVHTDNPVLHSAIEKLSAGVKMTELTPEERDEHRRYRRELYARNREK